VADPIPSTQKGQLDNFYTALGVPAGDYAAAMAAIASFKEFANWQNDQQALFNALGVKDQVGAITMIGQLKTPPVAPVAVENTDLAEIFTALGVKDKANALSAVGQFKTTAAHYQGLLAILEVQDQAGAIVAIGKMSTADKNHAALVTALGATDHATALTAATDIDATVTRKVKEQAAAAGLPAPAEKGSVVTTPGGEKEKAVTPRSRLAASINAQLA
jgi:hypothetical protein